MRAMAHVVDDWEIVADIAVLREVGRGSYGKVCVGNWDGAVVAVKMLHEIFLELQLPGNQLGNFLKKFKDEWETMKVLRHPNILQLFDIADARSAQAKMITELMDETLESRLAEIPKLSNQMQLHILRSVVCGLRYLHEHPRGPIVHRDLASKNILLASEASHVKIADLGVAKALGDAHCAVTGSIMPGTELCMPPEARSSVSVHPSLDIFSYGVVIVETLVARLPSPSPLFVPVAERPGDLRRSPEIERRWMDIRDIPEDHPLRQTVLTCLNDNAIQRPSASTIFETVFQHLPLKYNTLQETRQQLGQLNKDNAKLKKDNADLKCSNTHLTSEVTNLKAYLTDLKSDNTSVR